MEAAQDAVNEAMRERKGEIISEAEDEELITKLESRDYVIRKQHAACDCNNSTTNPDRVCDVCKAKLDKTFEGYVLLKEHFRVIQIKDQEIAILVSENLTKQATIDAAVKQIEALKKKITDLTTQTFDKCVHGDDANKRNGLICQACEYAKFDKMGSMIECLYKKG
jgi:hypothetical protein